MCGSHRPCPYLFRAEIPGSGPGAGRPVGVLRTCLACVVGQAVAPASRRSDTRGAEDEARRGCTCVTAVTLLQTRNCPMLGGAHGQGTAPTLTASVPKVPSCHPRSHCKGEGRLPVSRLSDRKFILDAPRGRTVSPESPDVEDEDTGGVRGEGAAEEGRREGQPCGVRRPGARGAGGLRGLEGQGHNLAGGASRPPGPGPSGPHSGTRHVRGNLLQLQEGFGPSYPRATAPVTGPGSFTRPVLCSRLQRRC